VEHAVASQHRCHRLDPLRLSYATGGDWTSPWTYPGVEPMTAGGGPSNDGEPATPRSHRHWLVPKAAAAQGKRGCRSAAANVHRRRLPPTSGDLGGGCDPAAPAERPGFCHPARAGRRRPDDRQHGEGHATSVYFRLSASVLQEPIYPMQRRAGPSTVDKPSECRDAGPRPPDRRQEIPTRCVVQTFVEHGDDLRTARLVHGLW
jgi:hypothetical protein